MIVHTQNLTENTLLGNFVWFIRNFVMFRDHYQMSISQ